MKVSYQNANPHRGHESYYIKFEDVSSTTTNCVLVDSGEGVNVEEDLEDDEYLSAILLTHAHADHYQTLGDNIEDGAKVLTTPATASVLETSRRFSTVTSRLLVRTSRFSLNMIS